MLLCFRGQTDADNDATTPCVDCATGTFSTAYGATGTCPVCDCQNGGTCAGFDGATLPYTHPRTCQHHWLNGNAVSGLYTIYPQGPSGFNMTVHCDMHADWDGAAARGIAQGWTLISASKGALPKDIGSAALTNLQSLEPTEARDTWMDAFRGSQVGAHSDHGCVRRPGPAQGIQTNMLRAAAPADGQCWNVSYTAPYSTPMTMDDLAVPAEARCVLYGAVANKTAAHFVVGALATPDALTKAKDAATRGETMHERCTWWHADDKQVGFSSQPEPEPIAEDLRGKHCTCELQLSLAACLPSCCSRSSLRSPSQSWWRCPTRTWCGTRPLRTLQRGRMA